MTEKQFNDVLNSRLDKIKQVLAVKAKEYVRNEDRLHNFHVGSRLENEHPSRVLHGMMLKHYISYLDIIRDVETGKPIKKEVVDEKIGDLINYLILQECILTEHFDSVKEQKQIEAPFERSLI